MYEKPQYITPGGFKRTNKNPNIQQKPGIKSSENTSIQKKKLAFMKQLAAQKVSMNPQKEISKEAARLIAQALKGMLHK